jgi:hypothetical protein
MAIDANQPQIDKSYDLLKSGHEYNGLKLDLYGEMDDGYQVYDIALAGTTISLFELVDTKALVHLSNWLTDHSPSDAEQQADARQQARIDRAKVQREENWIY